MKPKQNVWKNTTRKNEKLLALWTGSWLLSMALATYGPKFLWDYNPVISVLFIVINTALGVGMIMMNRKLLNGLDELHRKIQMDAMAIALGIGVVGGLSFSMLDVVDVISFDAEISHFVFLIGISYLVAIVVGNMRYK